MNATRTRSRSSTRSTVRSSAGDGDGAKSARGAKGIKASGNRRGASTAKTSARKGGAAKQPAGGGKGTVKGASSARKGASSARKPASGRGGSASKGSATGRKAASSPSSARKGARRGSRTPIGQAIEMLTADHRRVQKMFRDGERAKEDTERLRQIVEECCAALTLHADIEEQYFYPVMREAGNETDMIAEAYVEHASAKQLIAQIADGTPGDEDYAAMFKVLGEYVAHHVQEEEKEIFPKARRARGDFEPLVNALTARDDALEGGADSAGDPQPPARSSGGQEANRGRGGARPRQGRGRQSEDTAGEQDEKGMAGTATATAGTEPDTGAEQPRRGRRSGQQADSDDSDGATHGRGGEDQETGRGTESGSR